MNVTDAMIEIAAKAAYGAHYERYQNMMRKALEAVFAALPQVPAVDGEEFESAQFELNSALEFGDYARAERIQIIIDALRRAALSKAHLSEGAVEFAKEMCRVGFDGGSIDGSDILDTAAKYNLVRWVQYDPAVHGNIANREYLEPGDGIYVFSKALASPSPNDGEPKP